MTILTKFGGSSLSNAVQYQKVKAIIQSDANRRFVVVSAPGKDDAHPFKVTDLLLLLHAHIEYHIDYAPLLDQIHQRYLSIIQALNIECAFEEKFELFKKDLKKGLSKDDIASRGEYFQAIVMSAYLGFEMLDAKHIIHLKYDGTHDEKLTQESLQKLTHSNGYYVIPGFYGVTPDLRVKTLNRGGSDLTGSIICQALHINTYENWTDVDGLYVIDPMFMKHAKSIEKITYHELRELSYRGAQVIQQESIIPLEKSGVQLHIKNTNDPTAFGTLIASVIEEKGDTITGLTSASHFSSVTVTKESYIPLISVLKEVLDVLKNYHITLQHLPTGIDSFSLIIETHQLTERYFEMMASLQNIKGISDIHIENDIALIAVVGRNMAHIPGVAGKIFQTLGHAHINIKIIAQASNEISIIIGVKQEDLALAMNVLYQAFYEDLVTPNEHHSN
jgi:aspartate kinase